MAMRSSFTASLLVLALSGCAGNQDVENALKPDFRLRETPRSAEVSTAVVRSPEPLPSTAQPSKPSLSPTPTDWQDLDKLPTQLKPYVEDLLALNLLKPDSKTAESKAVDQDKLNAPITRREFAKWLLLINNRYYQARPTRQIRVVGVGNSPAFSDISSTDSDFTVLQSLAEAGILPSSLSGEDKTEKFRPTDPLTREDLLRWKVPLDIRSGTNTPTPIDTLQKALPFQDRNKVTHPDSIRAVASDLQNGDQSNLRRSFGYTKLLQPQRNVTRSEAAAALWSIGAMPEVLTAKEALTGKPEPTPSSPSP